MGTSKLGSVLQTCASGFVLRNSGLADPSADLGRVLEQAETLVIPQLARELHETEGPASVAAARDEGRAAVEAYLTEKRSTGGTWAAEIIRKGGSPDEVIEGYEAWTAGMFGAFLPSPAE